MPVPTVSSWLLRNLLLLTVVPQLPIACITLPLLETHLPRSVAVSLTQCIMMQMLLCTLAAARVHVAALLLQLYADAVQHQVLVG